MVINDYLEQLNFDASPPMKLWCDNDCRLAVEREETSSVKSVLVF